MKKVLKTAAAVMVSVVLVILAACTSGDTAPATTAVETAAGLPVVGSTAPGFTLATPDGESVSLEDFRGRPVLVNFWATWCGPCRYEIPFLQAVADNEEWQAAGLGVIAVNVQGAPDQVARFMAEYDIDLTVLLDSQANVASDYNLRWYPTTYFLDKDGIIQKVKYGAYITQGALEQDVAALVGGESE